MTSKLLIKIIDDELSWREKEMALAKVQLQRAIGTAAEFPYAYRCFVAISYAHFEGFTKRILEQALDDIIQSSLSQSECGHVMQINLLAPAARKMVEKLSNADLISRIFRPSEAINLISYPKPEEVFDISSMEFRNFEKAICCVGLNISQFEPYRAYINKITYLRHECAHGEPISMDVLKKNFDLAKDVFFVQSKIIDVMHELAVRIIDRFEAMDFSI